MKKILIADDEQPVRLAIATLLAQSYTTLQAGSGKECLALAAHEKPDLILLDVEMPEMDGFETCRRLREQPATSQIPIVMLTGASAPDSQIKGLGLGADDYITKPFHAGALIARVEAKLRRIDLDANAETEILIGNLRLAPRSCQVWVGELIVPLTQMEFTLLQYFVMRPNKLINRHELLGNIWPDSAVADRTVDTHVANLRKKIKGSTCQLETVQRAGYILKPGP